MESIRLAQWIGSHEQSWGLAMNQAMTVQSPHHRSWLSSFATLVSLVVVSTGCGPAAVPVSDEREAERLLNEAFDQWKSGATLEDMRKRSKPIFVTEDLWRNGSILSDFSIVAGPEKSGTNVRIQVNLKYKSSQGKEAQRKIWYLVTTVPALTISREDG
jgi:hypothetical protein